MAGGWCWLYFDITGFWTRRIILKEKEEEVQGFTFWVHLSSLESLVNDDLVSELHWVYPQLFAYHEDSDALFAQETSSYPGSQCYVEAFAAEVLLD